MIEVSKKYTAEIEGYADISIEFLSSGSINLVFPKYPIPAEKLCTILRTIADNLEKINGHKETGISIADIGRSVDEL